MKIFSGGSSRILPLPDDSESDPFDQAMDSKLWSKLPEDCVDRILARLPLPTMFRLRLVCKRWNSFIVSDSFFGLQSEIQSGPARSGFLLCTLGRVSCIFDFALSAWHFVPVPRIILPITIPPVSVASATSSLLLYANQVAECSSLFICNPFTKSLRELPPMPRIRLIHKLSITASNTGYSIMVSGEDGGAAQMLNPHVYRLHTEVYSSSARTWEAACGPPPDAKFGGDPGVWLESGRFYCITELPYGVVCFDLNTRNWSEVRAEMPPLLGCPTLVVHKRTRLMMVGRVQRPVKQQQGEEQDGLRVWELEEMGAGIGMWVEMSRPPVEMWGEFVNSVRPRTPLVAAGVGNLICVTTHLSPRVMVVDVGTRNWRWLPRDPLFPRQRNFRLLGFSFEPRLDSQP